jgi:hypothetical protein
MTDFPEIEHIIAISARASTDVRDKDHGCIMFESAGKIQVYQLSPAAFVRLGRDIQSEARQLDPQSAP